MLSTYSSDNENVAKVNATINPIKKEIRFG
jgi:hypothetical protein